MTILKISEFFEGDTEDVQEDFALSGTWNVGLSSYHDFPTEPGVYEGMVHTVVTEDDMQVWWESDDVVGNVISLPALVKSLERRVERLERKGGYQGGGIAW